MLYTDCFVAMRFNSLGAYLTIGREFYEAYCVWSANPPAALRSCTFSS